jgi:hypothetical protein
LTIVQVIKQDLLVLVAGKDIHPTLNGKSYKIQVIRVMELIFSAQNIKTPLNPGVFPAWFPPFETTDDYFFSAKALSII